MSIDPKLSIADHAKKARTLLDEFKAFAFKGSVVDLTIGVVIGGAFHKIIDSLVSNVIMPIFAAIMPGNRGYLGWHVTIKGSTIHFGAFIGDVVHFLIISAAMFFFVVKFLGWILRLQKDEIKRLPAMTKDQELLTEIRDLLAKKTAAEA